MCAWRVRGASQVGRVYGLFQGLGIEGRWDLVSYPLHEVSSNDSNVEVE